MADPPPPTPWAAPAPAAPARPALPGSPAALYSRGETLRDVGRAMTIISILATVAGIIMTPIGGLGVLNSCDGQWEADCRRAERTSVAGISLIAIGHVGLFVGIPLWSVGRGRMDRAMSLGYRPASALPYVTPTHNGAVAGVRLLTF
jgi:hypothetical protein